MSEILICQNIKMDRGYKNVLDYSQVDMLNLCSANAKYRLDNYQFLKTEREQIQVNINWMSLQDCNYIAFRNENVLDKWFFAWIDSVEYLNEATSRINYTIDVWSTWFDYFNFVSTFVVREHSSSDNVGDNIVAEPITVANIVCNEIDIFSCTEHVLVVQYVSENKNNKYSYQGSSVNNFGLVSGCDNVYFDLNRNGLDQLDQFIINMQGKENSIVAMFIYPKRFAGTVDTLPRFHLLKQETQTVSRPTTVNGYYPKNNKLFTYPYSFLTVSDIYNSNIYKYEFLGANIEFRIAGTYIGAPELLVIPSLYKGIANNYSESLHRTVFPQVCFPVDSYLSWRAQYGASMAIKTGLSLGAGALTGVLSGASGNLIGSGTAIQAINAGVGLASSMIEADNLSNRYIGSNSGEVLTGLQQDDIYFKKMSINKEQAIITDNYFSMYGYQTNKVKIPNIHNRYNWNYIETTGETVKASINQEALDTINSACNSGVTIWHSHSKMNNYGDMSNSIIGD